MPFDRRASQCFNLCDSYICILIFYNSWEWFVAAVEVVNGKTRATLSGYKFWGAGGTTKCALYQVPGNSYKEKCYH